MQAAGVRGGAALRFGPNLGEEREAELRDLDFDFPMSLIDSSALQEAQQPSRAGSGEESNGTKATPEGQVRVPFLEETAAGKVVTLALATVFPMSCSFSRAPQRGAVFRKHASAYISFNRPSGAPRRLMREAKNVWRKKNKGRKWRRPDGACVCKEGREPVQSLLVFPNFKF